MAERGLAVRRLRGLSQGAVLPILHRQGTRVTAGCMEGRKRTGAAGTFVHENNPTHIILM